MSASDGKKYTIKRYMSDDLTVGALADFMQKHVDFITGDGSMGAINVSVPEAFAHLFKTLDGYYEVEEALGQLERMAWKLRNEKVIEYA